MSAFPKDGSTFVVECIDRTAYRWAKYKPQGAKQMGKPGRWQKQVISGDWHRWENCEEPVGEISPHAEDGPISKAFKQYGALDQWRHEVGKLHSQISTLKAGIKRLSDEEEYLAENGSDDDALTVVHMAARLASVEAENALLRGKIEQALNCFDGEPEYHDQGMGCGLEDRGITDRYDAMAHGWEKAMERVYSENIAWAKDALSSPSPAAAE